MSNAKSRLCSRASIRIGTAGGPTTASRQTFVVSNWGWDTHDGQSANLPALIQELDGAIIPVISVYRVVTATVPHEEDDGEPLNVLVRSYNLVFSYW